VALELVRSFGIGFGEKDLSPEAYKAIQEMEEWRGLLYDAHQDIYHAAVEICKHYDTVESHKIAYDAYRNLPAAYRKDAIRELARSIDLGNNSPFDVYRLGLHLADDHEYDKAIACICDAISLEPHNPLFYTWLARTLVKQNKIDAALEILNSYKNSKYYTDDVVNTCIGPQKGSDRIDRNIKDLEDKKARGYVFHPRNTK
jgi:tetratricopeptide (TPR) repeat protein